MTRSERKKISYEKLKQKEIENKRFYITGKQLLQTCMECEFCSKIWINDFSDYKEKWICFKKARKDMAINSNSISVCGYPYGEVNGKCDSLCFMKIQDEVSEI